MASKKEESDKHPMYDELVEMANRAHEQDHGNVAIVLYTLVSSISCGADSAYARHAQDFAKLIVDQLQAEKLGVVPNRPDIQ